MALSSRATADLQIATQNPLFQPDILQYILDCLAPPEVDPGQFGEFRPVLLSLARTCRAFSEPSLDRLWSKLDSLEPLIRCFATVLNEETAKTPPSPAEWDIIHRYSHRIRELIRPCTSFSLHFLRSTSLYPSLLVPNLRVLSWHPTYTLKTWPSLSITLIQRLLSPSLISLNVTLNDVDDVALQSFFANHPFTCPNLKSLSINIDGDKQISRMNIEILSRAIPSHGHLECLTVSAPIISIALMHIAMSPKLRKLTLLCPDASDQHPVRIPSDVTPFRNVEELSLEVWDIHFITTLLRTHDQMFRSFVLRHHFRPTTEAVITFFTALASHQRTHSLRSINVIPIFVGTERFAIARAADETAMLYHLSYDTLRPLASLIHLHKLVVDVGHWFSIDDDDLVSLICNWPFLKVLRLDCHRYLRECPWLSIKYVTFKGLLSLLEYCPDLYEICVPLDAREVPVTTAGIICNPELMDIDFPNSPIGDPRLVGEILTRHFPSVIAVGTWFSLAPENQSEVSRYRDLWKEVDEYLEDMHGHDEDPGSVEDMSE